MVCSWYTLSPTGCDVAIDHWWAFWPVYVCGWSRHSIFSRACKALLKLSSSIRNPMPKCTGFFPLESSLLMLWQVSLPGWLLANYCHGGLGKVVYSFCYTCILSVFLMFVKNYVARAGIEPARSKTGRF